MKKVSVIIVSILLFLAVAPFQLKAGSETKTTANTPISAVESARAAELMKRLEEIKSMDKSDMGRVEKKEIRNEVREIKKEMKRIGGGIYISVGAILIIILLIILL